MAGSKTNDSPGIHPEGLTPILTVNIPGGMAINLLGVLTEICPICISVNAACPDQGENKAIDALGSENPCSYSITLNSPQPQVIADQENVILDNELNKSDSDGIDQASLVSDHSSGSKFNNKPETVSSDLGGKIVTNVATGTIGNTTNCSCKKKGIHSNNVRKESKPQKLLKKSKHLRSLKSPLPVKNTKPVKPPRSLKHQLPSKPAKPLKPAKPPKPPKPLKPAKPRKLLKPLKSPKPPKPLKR
jgi:hypothetical protein